MSKQLMIYKSAVPVSTERHRKLSVEEVGDYRHAAGINVVPLLTSEFEIAAREFPIAFIRASDGETVPVAMLSLRHGENLYVEDDGSWRARYVPAFLRRYPFVFANGQTDDTFVLSIDEAFRGCNADGRGEALFDEDGSASDYLQRMLSFTKSYQHDAQTTRRFCETLDEYDLLADGEIRFSQGEAKAVTRGIMRIDRDQLTALDPARLSALFASGELEKIYAHLLSLRNLDDLARRLNDENADPKTTH